MTVRPLAFNLEVDVYKPGESKLPGFDKPIKLASNENPFGPSPKAKAAFIEAASKLEIYPEPTAQKLREAIGARYGVDPARIMCGAGSDEIFFLLTRAYLEPGDEIIVTEHSFSIYEIAAKQSGAVTRIAKDRGMDADVDALLACVTPKTKMLFLANPNNPTGTYLSFSEVKRLHAGLPDSVLLILDAAYAEYVRRNDYSSGLEMAGEFENVLMTRTFSKIYGLAAARLGWAYGPQSVIDALNRARGPFNVSTPAMMAGIAAMQDQDFADMSADHNARELARVTAAIEAMGVEVTPSAANFLLAHFGPGGAAKVDAHLRARGYIVRAMLGYGLPDALRISIGSTEQNSGLLAALKDYFGMIFHRIALIGVGHIGASIALAARAANATEFISLYDASETARARLRELDLGEVFDSPAEAVAKAELVILCTPVGSMKAAAESVARYLKIGAIVSDVGSVKRAVVDAVQPVLPDYVYFVPGHPLAGTEHSGPDAGVETLFQKRWALITPLDDAREAYEAAVGQLEEFWQRLGANVERMDVDRHDVVLAVTSHLPHLIAFNIVAMAEDLESVTESEVVKFSASGFRDFTRIAASDPTMWRDVFLNNREAVLEVLGRFSEDLAALQRAIRWGDGDTLYDLFARARRMRREVIEAGQDANWGRDKT